MRRRSRSRSREPNSLRWATLATVAVTLAVAFGGGSATTAFTTAGVDRTPNVDVVSDVDAALGLDSATAVHVDATEDLVTATNELDRPASITVALRASSAADADLVVGGVNEGDRVSLTLARGETWTVEVVVANDTSLVGSAVNFDVDASAPGLEVQTNNRSVPIEG